MKGLVLASILFFWGVYAAEETTTDGIMQEIVTALYKGPVKLDFTPDFLAERTMEAVITAQTNRFRERVVRLLMESYDTSLVVCVDSSKLGSTAARAVMDELSARGFTVEWSSANDSCQSQKGTFQDALLFTNLAVPKK